MAQPVTLALSALPDRLGLLAGAAADRVIVGIAGPPGVGKSTVAASLAEQYEGAMVVPFDGFHLSNQVLRDLGRGSRKGAPDTFDLAGYRDLVQRLRANEDDVVYAPVFRREIEEPVAAGIAVDRSVRVIIVEGNYLLLEQPDLRTARDLLDEAWYLELDDETRRQRLIARHIRFGRSAQAAHDWAVGTDEANARVIRAARSAADVIVRVASP
ncbi:MAG: nucleoside/nucleotide kinase family protein [Frankiales bacterium]|nr:nucleoside/nucleotide kinase family protein [Frankiales bacterium]